jgi:hypothetical protein
VLLEQPEQPADGVTGATRRVPSHNERGEGERLCKRDPAELPRRQLRDRHVSVLDRPSEDASWTALRRHGLPVGPDGDLRLSSEQTGRASQSDRGYHLKFFAAAGALDAPPKRLQLLEEKERPNLREWMFGG